MYYTERERERDNGTNTALGICLSSTGSSLPHKLLLAEWMTFIGQRATNRSPEVTSTYSWIRDCVRYFVLRREMDRRNPSLTLLILTLLILTLIILILFILIILILLPSPFLLLFLSLLVLLLLLLLLMIIMMMMMIMMLLVLLLQCFPFITPSWGIILALAGVGVIERVVVLYGQFYGHLLTTNKK